MMKWKIGGGENGYGVLEFFYRADFDGILVLVR